jgi:CheY-like chemotaxis protein
VGSVAEAAALVVITDPEASTATPEDALKRLFGLTRADYLRTCGYRVLEAGGDRAQGRCAHRGVFNDVQMPGEMDGWALARWVRRERPEVRVILTSGLLRTTESAGDLCEEGPLLQKPYSHIELEHRIRLLLAKDRP